MSKYKITVPEDVEFNPRHPTFLALKRWARKWRINETAFRELVTDILIRYETNLDDHHEEIKRAIETTVLALEYSRIAKAAA